MNGLEAYQIRIAQTGAAILKQYLILILVMEMRTRKTTTTFEIIAQCGFKNVLFLTKKKAISSIEKDFHRFLRPFVLTVVNYESIHTLKDPNFDIVVCDESHCLGAYPKRSKKVDTVKRIAQNLPIIFLSATITPESYSQIYHQLYVSSYSPFKLYPNFYKWARDYVVVTQKMIRSKLVNDYSKANGVLIKKKIDHLSVSITQEDAGFKYLAEDKFLVIGMPDNIEYILKCLDKDQICYYLDKVITVNGPADLIMKKSQLAGCTIIPDHHDEGIVLSKAKAEYIKDRFAGLKIAVLYKFKAERQMLLECLENVTEDPMEFEANDNLTFIGQFISTREGVNLASADCLVMYNIDYSATTYFQSRARIQTLTRDKPALVYWVWLQGGIEKAIYGAVSKKKNFTTSYYLKNGLGKS